MSESKKTRIKLWNAVSLADDLIAKLSFRGDASKRLIDQMGEEIERFTIIRNTDDTISFRRKEDA
jgi:hypothetical protein